MKMKHRMLNKVHIKFYQKILDLFCAQGLFSLPIHRRQEPLASLHEIVQIGVHPAIICFIGDERPKLFDDLKPVSDFSHLHAFHADKHDSILASTSLVKETQLNVRMGRKRTLVLRVRGGAGQDVDAVVFGMAAVALDPVPLDAVPGDRFQ